MGPSQAVIPSGVKHEVVLRTASGELLDRSGPYAFIEEVIITGRVNGSASFTSRAGTDVPYPDFDGRAARSAALQSQVEQFITSAAQAKLIADASLAKARFLEEIERARGELLIIDPYFGKQDPNEWRLLDQVSVPVRVVSKGVKQGSVLGSNVRARRYSNAVMHDRAYIWDGGGLSVGGSPSTFGKGAIRFARIDAAEVAEWRQKFDAYWNDTQFTEYQNRPSS